MPNINDRRHFKHPRAPRYILAVLPTLPCLNLVLERPVSLVNSAAYSSSIDFCHPVL